MAALIDMTRRKYGRLTILERVPTTRKVDDVRWRAKCECGTVTVVGGRDVRRGRTRSCGCWRIEVATAQLKRLNAQPVLTCQWCHSMQEPDELMPVLFAVEPGGSGMQCRDDRACNRRRKQLAR